MATGAFSLDFVIHGDAANPDGTGPASRWAATATPGTTIEAALTPARIDLPSDMNHILIAGDLTAGERGLIKQVRLVIKQDLELKKDHHFSQFYWFEGKPTG